MFSFSLVHTLLIFFAVSVIFFFLGFTVRSNQVKRLKKELDEVKRELMDAYAEFLKKSSVD